MRFHSLLARPSARFDLAVLVSLSLTGCEPESVTPTPTQVCLPFSSGENIDLCASALCVERATTQTVNGATAGEFTRRSGCPTPEIMAADGLKRSDYLIDYGYNLGTFDANISLIFNGDLCTRGLSAQALRETFIRGSTGQYVPVSVGRDGYVGGALANDDIEFIGFAAGRLHVRIKAEYRSIQRGSDELLCVNGSGHVPTPSSCACSYVGGPFAYTFDLDVPMSPIAN